MWRMRVRFSEARRDSMTAREPGVRQLWHTCSGTVNTHENEEVRKIKYVVVQNKEY